MFIQIYKYLDVYTFKPEVGTMADKKKDDEKEEDDTLTCTNCGDMYENTAALRRLKNKTVGKFICPDCLAELHGKDTGGDDKVEEEEEKEEEEEEEEEEEVEDEEEPEPKAKKKK